MKKIFLLLTTCLIGLHFICCSKADNAELVINASKTKLSKDIEFIAYGFELNGDSVVFFEHGENVPLLCNNSSETIDNIAIKVAISTNHIIELSQYYVVDSVVSEENMKTYFCHYCNNVIGPYADLPFPISKIVSKKENVAFMMEYLYNIGEEVNPVSIKNMIVGFHSKKCNPKLAPDNPQLAFFNLASPSLNYYKPNQIAIIYKDTVIPNLENANKVLNKPDFKNLTDLLN